MSGKYWWPINVEERGGYLFYQKLPCSNREWRRALVRLARFTRRPTLIHKGGKP